MWYLLLNILLLSHIWDNANSAVIEPREPRNGRTAGYFSDGFPDWTSGSTYWPTGSTYWPTGSTDDPTGSTDDSSGITDSPSGGTDGSSGGTDGSTTADDSCKNPKCGAYDKRPSGMIVNGVEVNPKRRFKAIVMLAYFERQHCGGTLISDRIVLTAAHCTEEKEATDFTVRLAAHMIQDDTSPLQVISQVLQKIEHPDYGKETSIANDFCILKIVPVVFNDNIQPACLPAVGNDYIGTTAVVAGWGALEAGGGAPDQLMEVSLQVISNSECQSSYAPNEKILDNMMCAKNPGKDSCQGDSGGPLFHLTGTRADLIGVVSWGYGCADPRWPGVYARVTDALVWIKEEMGKICS